MRKILTGSVICLLISIVSAGVWFGMTSPLFRIAHIHVTGSANTEALTYINHSGVLHQNIFTLDPIPYIQHIQTIPVIETVTFRKVLPNSIDISIQEKTPVLLWQTSTATFLVDAHGVIIGNATSNQLQSEVLPIIHDKRSTPVSVTNMPLTTGQELPMDDVQFGLAVQRQLFITFPDNSLSLNYSTPDMLYGNGGDFQIQSSAGWLANIGSTNDPNSLQNRCIEIQQVTKAVTPPQSIASIDVRYGFHATYTLHS